MEPTSSQSLGSWLPVASLLIAALAVFFGPMISFRLGKKQMESSVRVANRQIVAPLREKWISTLRELLSQLCSRCSAYRLTKTEPDEEELLRISELVMRIELYLNPKEDDHNDLLSEIRAMQSLLPSTLPHDDSKFWNSRSEVMRKAKEILKIEWERVKNEI